MLRLIGEITGYVLAAENGDIGRCKDFLFDDTQWAIRYMVADTGYSLAAWKGLDRKIFGSVADRVLRFSPVPVLCVNPFPAESEE
jgi:hypothetical protein